MEMNNAALKDGNLRTLVARSEQQRILYKAILQDRSLPQPLRYEFMLKLNKVSKKSSAVRTKNRCVLSGRGKGVLRAFKCSRIVLRELVSNGEIVGLTKSSW